MARYTKKAREWMLIDGMCNGWGIEGSVTTSKLTRLIAKANGYKSLSGLEKVQEMFIYLDRWLEDG